MQDVQTAGNSVVARVGLFPGHMPSRVVVRAPGFGAAWAALIDPTTVAAALQGKAAQEQEPGRKSWHVERCLNLTRLPAVQTHLLCGMNACTIVFFSKSWTIRRRVEHSSHAGLLI